MLALLLAAPIQGPGCPNPAPGPDLVVGEIGNVVHWGAVGDVGAYSFKITSCNRGDTEVAWNGGSAAHPITVQNLYRLEDGVLEQIGLSWARHATSALSGNFCCNCVPSGTGSRLGVGCSSASSATVGGSQTLMGPRSEVDAASGAFPFPFATQGQTGDAIYKRLQVAATDLDPTLHPGARYFAACQHVAADNAAAFLDSNDSSWREVVVQGFAQGQWRLAPTGVTQVGTDPIRAWNDLDPLVHVAFLDAPGSGYFLIGSRAYDRGDGTHEYVYAVYNPITTRAARSFEVEILPGSPIADLAFHDVEHHSGEPFSGADWNASLSADAVRFETSSFAADPNANALRWGTTYTFRFVAPSGPRLAMARLELFAPGGIDAVDGFVIGPDSGGAPESYCVGAPNSAGPGASLGFAGTVSLGANAFTLVATALPPQGFGLVFYGPNRIQVPFGDGFRCVGGTLRRLQPPLQTAATGVARRDLDFQSPPLSSGPGAITAGSTWNFQHWYRDAPAMAAGFNLTNGLGTTFVP